MLKVNSEKGISIFSVVGPLSGGVYLKQKNLFFCVSFQLFKSNISNYTYNDVLHFFFFLFRLLYVLNNVFRVIFFFLVNPPCPINSVCCGLFHIRPSRGIQPFPFLTSLSVIPLQIRTLYTPSEHLYTMKL